MEKKNQENKPLEEIKNFYKKGDVINIEAVRVIELLQEMEKWVQDEIKVEDPTLFATLEETFDKARKVKPKSRITYKGLSMYTVMNFLYSTVKLAYEQNETKKEEKDVQ